MKKNMPCKTVIKMVEIFKKMKPYEYINVYSLYEKAIKTIENPELDDSCFYLAFHEERKRQKIKIRHSNENAGRCVGLPMHVDSFYRLPSDKEIEKEFRKVREKYYKKYGFYPDDFICDMMPKPIPVLLKATKRSLERGTPLRVNETHVSAWNDDVPKFDELD